MRFGTIAAFRCLAIMLGFSAALVTASAHALLKRFLVVAALVAWLVMPSWGQDFGAGVAARYRGDYALALQELRQLAEQRDPAAQTTLGVMHARGEGVSQDYAEAVRWWRLAAQLGGADARSNLGLMYYKGLGVSQDYAEAVHWWRLAAEQGGADARSNLGLTYYKGLGVSQDYAEAVHWWRLAAEQGGADAQYNLGIVYVKGEGVPQDLVQAHLWLTLAATQGQKFAAKKPRPCGGNNVPSADRRSAAAGAWSGSQRRSSVWRHAGRP